MATILKIVGGNIRRMRKHAKLTLEELAEKAALLVGARELGGHGGIRALVVRPDGAACEGCRDDERNAALEKRVKHFGYPGRKDGTPPLPAAPGAVR